MNNSCAYGRRLSWLILSFCFTGACVLADQASNTEQCQKDLSACTAKVEQHRSRLKKSDEGCKQLTTLDHYLETMKSCVDRLPSLAGELTAQDTRLRDLKMLELEPKQREVEQIRQTTEARFSQLLYEKQSLEAAIDQHNSKPHLFTDMQLVERANYLAETEALKARGQRLMEAATLIQSEMQPRFDNASRAAAKAKQDFSETVSRRDKTTQLLQELTYQYAFTRSLLVEQLDKMDHEPAPATVPS